MNVQQTNISRSPKTGSFICIFCRSLACITMLILLITSSAFSMKLNSDRLASDPQGSHQADSRSKRSVVKPVPEPTNQAVLSGFSMTPEGRPINGATVVLLDEFGNVRRTNTNPFGLFGFSNVETDRLYTLFIVHKQYIFAFPSEMFEITGDMNGIALIGEPSF
ncbi:MAG: carboxypeptidase regulatory-like domain-containing protein [Acidobacteria bacterium]|nr:carboxypeptidase regulatory-like domain-containing protein [Acidobacteriota bacterium]